MKAKENFTAKRIAEFSCPQNKNQDFLWDAKAPGLGLRVTRAGSRSFIFESRLHGDTIRITIGDVRTWSVGQAQSEAIRLKAMVDQGIDPRAVKAEKAAAVQHAKREALRQELTLGDVWPRYIAERQDKWGDLHKRDHELVSQLGGLPKKRGRGLTEPGPLVPLLGVRLCELSGPRIAKWLEAEAVQRPARAALAFRLLSVFINWAASEEDLKGLVPMDACKHSRVRRALPKKKTIHGDCLEREQLAAWFTAVRSLSNPAISAYLQCLLLTGARRRELAALQWTDIDWRWRRATIRDKDEGSREIPLSPYVLSLLQGLPRLNEWVFASPTSDSGCLAEPTPAHKRALQLAGLPDMTLHGLRRSFITLGEEADINAGALAQIAGHKPSALEERHYKRRTIGRLGEILASFESWMLAQTDISLAQELSRTRPLEPSLKVA